VLLSRANWAAEAAIIPRLMQVFVGRSACTAFRLDECEPARIYPRKEMPTGSWNAQLYYSAGTRKKAHRLGGLIPMVGGARKTGALRPLFDSLNQPLKRNFE
jgi:hypothetical protein